MIRRFGVGASLLVLSVLSGLASAAPSYTGSFMENMRAYVKDAGAKAEIAMSSELVYRGKTEDGWVVLGTMPEEMVAYSLQQWSEASASRLASSSFSENDVISKLVILGMKMTGCDDFDLTAVERLPLQQATLRTANGEQVIEPQAYSERWGVNACGKARTWHIYDANGTTEFVELVEP